MKALIRQGVENGPYRHTLAPAADINGGAMEMSFLPAWANPLFSFRGIARLAGQFLPFGSGRPSLSLHPIQPKMGLPMVTGEFYFQAPDDNAVNSEGVPING